MERFLAMHIGSTFITYGLCEGDGSFVEGSFQSVASPSDGSAYDMIHTLSQILDQFRGKVVKAGVAVAGHFDYLSGTFRMHRKFISMYGQSISPLFRAVGMEPVYMNNANVFLLGEMLQGSVKGHSSCSGLLLGASVGFSIASNNKVLCDESGNPPILLAVKPYRDGVVEDYICQKAASREYHQLSGYPDFIGIDELVSRATKGDFWARRVFNDIGTTIATVLKTHVPRRLYGGSLVLGGKMANASRFLAPPIANLLGIEVVQAAHVDDAVLRGIGSYVAMGREALLSTV